MDYDLIVIGAGPGGYVAAIRAAKLGKKVAVIEKDLVGGTCLNRGCIPAKALLHASSLYRETLEGERFGVMADGVRCDLEKMAAYKEETSAGLRGGVEQLFQANGVVLLRGTGRLEADRSVTFVAAGGKESVRLLAADVLLATGSRPSRIPVPGTELEGVLTSDELFARCGQSIEHLVIIGGGVIGVEFASIYSALGTRVTILEAMPRLLPMMDREFGQSLKPILKKRGVDIHTQAMVTKLEKDGDGLLCSWTEKEKPCETRADVVLLSVGRSGCTEGLFGEGVSLKMERGRLLTDERFRTSMEHVYAVGDVIIGPQLAHAASAQGQAVAEFICFGEQEGWSPQIRTDLVPGCVYTNPEIASVGMTEDEAKQNGIAVQIGKFRMMANGRSQISGEERGYVKLLFEQESSRLVGAQLMCARATDLIGELATAIANGLTNRQLLLAMRAHPTYGEGIAEAAEETLGGAIHQAPGRKRG